MNSKDFFYEFPKAAYLIVLVFVVFLLYFYLAVHRRQFLRNFAVDSVLKRVMSGRSLWSVIQKVLLICGTWIFAALALMNPQGNARYPDELLASLNQGKHDQALKRRPHEIAFVLDTSRSMDVKDMRTGQSRLDFGKEIIDEMIRGLKGETVSLYTFTSEGDQLVPPTLDAMYTRLLLKNLTTDHEGVGGSDLTTALQKVMQDFTELSNEVLKTIVFISDGEDLKYQDLSTAEKAQYQERLAAILGNVKAENLRLFSVGLGTKEGGVVPKVLYEGKEVRSSMNEILLKELAAKGRGDYYSGNQYSSRAIAEAILQSMSEDNPYKPLYETKLDKTPNPRDNYIYDRYYQQFLAIAALLLALALLIPDRWRQSDV